MNLFSALRRVLASFWGMPKPSVGIVYSLSMSATILTLYLSILLGVRSWPIEGLDQADSKFLLVEERPRGRIEYFDTRLLEKAAQGAGRGMRLEVVLHPVSYEFDRIGFRDRFFLAAVHPSYFDFLSAQGCKGRIVPEQIRPGANVGVKRLFASPRLAEKLGLGCEDLGTRVSANGSEFILADVLRGMPKVALLARFSFDGYVTGTPLEAEPRRDSDGLGILDTQGLDPQAQSWWLSRLEAGLRTQTKRNGGEALEGKLVMEPIRAHYFGPVRGRIEAQSLTALLFLYYALCWTIIYLRAQDRMQRSQADPLAAPVAERPSDGSRWALACGYGKRMLPASLRVFVTSAGASLLLLQPTLNWLSGSSLRAAWSASVFALVLSCAAATCILISMLNALLLGVAPRRSISERVLPGWPDSSRMVLLTYAATMLGILCVIVYLLYRAGGSQAIRSLIPWS